MGVFYITQQMEFLRLMLKAITMTFTSIIFCDNEELEQTPARVLFFVYIQHASDTHDLG